MDVKQIAAFVNAATKEVSGMTDLIAENLSNVVEIGNTLENIGGLDAYVKALPNVIGKYVFVNRKYAGGVPSILMDGWEFGSILGKVRGNLPEATENESWELQDGASYDMGIFTKPDVSVKFFNKKVTFEIPLSITEKQVKQSFHSAAELNAFIELLYNEVDKSMTVKLDALIMRTLNNITAETIYNGVGSDLGESSVRAVNLLALYNALHPTATITAAAALETPEFLRFAVRTMRLYKKRMKKMSTLFNMEGTPKFTPEEYLRIVLLDDFESAVRVNLYDANGQFNNDELALGNYDTVPYWQGSGDDYALDSVSTLNVVTASNHAVECSGIVGVMFDRDACAVCNQDRRVTTAPFNAKGEFWNYWHKWDCEYINDFAENFVVFFIHDDVQA